MFKNACVLLLTAALSEMGSAFKGVKKYLVDERDQYLAYKIKNALGNKVVAVLGAAHVPGIKEEIFKEQNISDLEVVPPKSNVGKVIGWMIPIILLALIVVTFIANPSSGWEQDSLTYSAVMRRPSAAWSPIATTA